MLSRVLDFRKLYPFKWGGMLSSAAASWRRAEGQDLSVQGRTGHSVWSVLLGLSFHVGSEEEM